VKRLLGCSEKTGRAPSCSGRIPVRIAGTAFVVHASTVAAFRNHVDPPASSAKLGYRTGSIPPVSSRRDVVGISSKTTRTTGVVDATASARGSGSCALTSLPVGDAKRKSPRKTSGTGARTVQKVLTGGKRV
jgi:hypothetical protein